MSRRTRCNAQRGFTLIEILVVGAITAILLSLAMLRIDSGGHRALARSADDLAQLLEAARDESVIRGKRLAFSSDGQGYQFWIADGDGTAWVALPAADTLRSGSFPEGITLSALRINGLARPLGERIAFSISGNTEAFTLTLANASSRVDIAADALGRIAVTHAQ